MTVSETMMSINATVNIQAFALVPVSGLEDMQPLFQILGWEEPDENANIDDEYQWKRNFLFIKCCVPDGLCE